MGGVLHSEFELPEAGSDVELPDEDDRTSELVQPQMANMVTKTAPAIPTRCPMPAFLTDWRAHLILRLGARAVAEAGYH